MVNSPLFTSLMISEFSPSFVVFVCSPNKLSYTCIGRLHMTPYILRQKKWLTKTCNLCWKGIERTPSFGIIFKTNGKFIKNWNELLLIGSLETNNINPFTTNVAFSQQKSRVRCVVRRFHAAEQFPAKLFYLVRLVLLLSDFRDICHAGLAKRCVFASFVIQRASDF